MEETTIALEADLEVMMTIDKEATEVVEAVVVTAVEEEIEATMVAEAAMLVQLCTREPNQEIRSNSRQTTSNSVLGTRRGWSTSITLILVSESTEKRDIKEDKLLVLPDKS